MKMNDKLYDILKWIGRYLLPAMGALYFAIAEIWNFPLGPEICATCTALTVALNTLLGISSENYYKNGGDNDE